MLCVLSLNDNDNDKRLGLTAKADQPDHKKIQLVVLVISTGGSDRNTRLRNDLMC